MDDNPGGCTMPQFGKESMSIDYKDLFSFLTFLIAVVGFAMNMGKMTQRVSALETRASEDRGDLKAIRAIVETMQTMLAADLATMKNQITTLNSKVGVPDRP